VAVLIRDAANVRRSNQATKGSTVFQIRREVLLLATRCTDEGLPTPHRTEASTADCATDFSLECTFLDC
jgi:hypothetical protein